MLKNYINRLVVFLKRWYCEWATSEDIILQTRVGPWGLSTSMTCNWKQLVDGK